MFNITGFGVQHPGIHVHLPPESAFKILRNTHNVEERQGRPSHPRITYFAGSPVADDVVARVQAEIQDASTVLVILDSDHSRDHVLGELKVYAPMVTKGSYLIVEDTNLNGHPVLPEHGPGPMEAVEAFVARHPEFAHDAAMDKFLPDVQSARLLEARSVTPRWP